MPGDFDPRDLDPRERDDGINDREDRHLSLGRGGGGVVKASARSGFSIHSGSGTRSSAPFDPHVAEEYL